MLRLEPKAFFISLWIETLFYGFHLVLFCICVFILLRHKRHGYSILLVTAVAIFFFSTTHFVLVFYDDFEKFFVIWKMAMSGGRSSHHRLRHSDDTLPTKHGFKEHLFFGLNGTSFAYLMNSFFADALVIYRCYAIWNTDYIVCPVLLLLVTTMVGVADTNKTHLAIQLRQTYFALSLGTNLAVTCMSAGRIWWITRDARLLVVKPEVLHRYRRASIIVLETGALYSVIVLVFIVLCQSDATEGAALIVQDALAQIMGILPTLTLVIAALGLEFSTNDTSPDHVFRDRRVTKTRTSSYHQPDESIFLNIV